VLVAPPFFEDVVFVAEAVVGLGLGLDEVAGEFVEGFVVGEAGGELGFEEARVLLRLLLPIIPFHYRHPTLRLNRHKIIPLRRHLLHPPGRLPHRNPQNFRIQSHTLTQSPHRSFTPILLL